MTWLRWVAGKAGGGYRKMILLHVRNVFEVSLLRLRTGEEVAWHRDVGSMMHRDHTFSLVLWRAKKGGQVMTKIYVKPRQLPAAAAKLTLRHKLRWASFRSDLTEHAVSKVEEGSTLILHYTRRTKSQARGKILPR